MASPKGSGTQSPEYKAFRSNFVKLADAVGHDLPMFASKAFAKNLISKGTLREAIEGHKNAKLTLMMNLTDKIEQEKDKFDEILDILDEMPSLKTIQDKLKEARVSKSELT